MRTLMIVAALAFVAGAPVAHAQHMDDKGKCHDASGKFAKAEVCAAKGAGGYKLDPKGKCHGPDGKFAKADKCKS